MADRICGVFVPAVLVCAVATLAGWLLAGSPAEHAFSAGLAVLIIACPCALGLATPAALVAASGRGASNGIFVKEYQALESSRAVDVVVLDKTGTVTTGRMELAGVQSAVGVTRADLLRYAGAVEDASEHSVAAAISAAARKECGPLPLADAFRALPGSARAAQSTAWRSSSGGHSSWPSTGWRWTPNSPGSAASGSRRAGPRCWSAGTEPSAARSRSPTRSRTRPPPPSPNCARSGCTRSC